MSLVFNMLSRLVILFLPRIKHLLISWLQWPSAVILEPKKRKSVTTSTFPPSICHEVMGPDVMILVFSMLFQFSTVQLLSCVQLFVTPWTIHTVHGILKVRILEWVAVPFSRGSSQPRDLTCVSSVSCIGRWVLYHEHNLLKSKDITLPTKIHIIKAMVFPVVMYGCKRWTIKKGLALKN